MMLRSLPRLACLAGALAGCLAVAPQSALAQAGTEAVQPGRVMVQGAGLYVSCVGVADSLPTVIFDNGLGETWRTWRDVQPAIGEVTRACAYDRLGAGQSDPVAENDTRTPFEMAETLDALLDALDVEGPIVLVGHSIAGFVLLAYPHLYPNEVAGLVFVDASHPDQWKRFMEIDSTAAPAGVFGAERVDAAAAERELAAVGTFGDLPVAVLHQASPNDRPQRRVWISLQETHAARSTRSRLIPGTESGHYVQNDQPDLVIEAILWVLGGGR